MKNEEMTSLTLQSVYEKLKTPYKYGAVLKFDERLCDSPSVFRYGNSWYMSFIEIDKNCSASGYESYLAKSDDLLHWKVLFPILERTDADVWNAKQRAAYAAFVNNDLTGNFEIQPVRGKYYFSHMGGNLNGYETDPLQMGEISTADLLSPSSYRAFPNPVLSPSDTDARVGERLTIYKGHFFIDKKQTLGHKYVCAYNAKDFDDVETVFLAVSDDGETWKRHLDRAVFREPDSKITGDPQIFTCGDLYVMIYFVLKNGKTYNNFAVSRDLVSWTRWTGEPLIQSEYEWENVFAHKVSFVVSDGVRYHFYCAVNSQGERFIAVAASRKTWEE